MQKLFVNQKPNESYVSRGIGLKQDMVAQYELNNKVHNWLSKEKETSFNCSILYNNSLYCSFFQHPHNFSRNLCKGAGLLDL